MSVSPFFRLIGITVEPDARNISQRKGGRGTAVVVRPSDDAQWHLNFSDVLHSWRHVATVDAIKLRNDIFLATWTIHSFIPFLSRYFHSLPYAVQISGKCAL